MDRTTSSETDALEGIRRLLDATIVATFVLIVLGGVVRVSDSGLGCGPEGSGTQGWPLCGGRLLPFLQEHQVIEFSHRLVATVVVVLIAALVFQALRHHRERHWLVRGTVAAAVLVLAQAALGGLTVEHGLHSALVAAHLGLAMLLLALLIVLRRITRPEPEAPAASGSRALRASAATTTVLLLATIVAGGYVAGTEGEGTPDQPALGAHLACGEQFPTCLNKFMPFEYGRLVDIQLTHRLFMYLTTIAAVIMCALAWRRRAPSRAFAVIPFLLAAQILLGAMNVWMGEHPWLIVSHLTLATALWATVVYAAASLIAVPASATRRRERPSPIRHATSG
ncbi:MAG: COX15/CtaA family protein [Solirubrobacterales bacterium]